MARVALVNPDTASDKQKALFTVVHDTLGGVPNLFRAVANSPAALEGMLGLFGALGKAKINVQLREQIALAVSQRNECGYCLAAHTTLSQGAGITSDVIAAARSARSGNPREQAALHFAVSLVEKHGHVSADEMNQLWAADFDAAEVLEIITTVIFSMFTNYVNSAVDTDVDFPTVPLNAVA